MADYINKSIICQAYLHIDPVPENLDETALKAELESFLGVRAEFFLYKDVGTEVELKEGSLKIYLTILGSLYAGIAQYPDFRLGIPCALGHPVHADLDTHSTATWTLIPRPLGH